MRIGIDISQIVYQGTGVARYVEMLVSTLTTIDRKNEYILYGNSLRKKAILDSFCKAIIEKNKMVNKRIISLPQTILEVIWNRLHILPIESFIGKIDLFHTADWLEPPAYCSKVTTVHDFLVFKYPYLFPQNLVKIQMRRISWVVRESKAIIVDSQSTKRDGVQLLKIPPEKIFVVYPGVSQNFKPASEELIHKVLKRFSIKKPYLLTVGVREPRKNIKMLIKVLNSIRKNIDLDLVIVGKTGWDREKIIGNNGIKSLGFISDEALQALYSACACFVYPSIDEGFGFPVLEALACGARVITSDKGSLKEIGGKYVLYADPNDAKSIERKILKILDDRNDRAEGIKWAKTFSWEKTAKEILAIYQKCV